MLLESVHMQDARFSQLGRLVIAPASLSLHTMTSGLPRRAWNVAHLPLAVFRGCENVAASSLPLASHMSSAPEVPTRRAPTSRQEMEML